jgi:CheY-like chemotaxis protein
MTTKKKILLVDDSHDILDLLEVFLFREYNIITAVNGFEALKSARENLPDLILTDIMMPVMDGIKFFNNLKAEPTTTNIPVIAVTSFIKKTNVKSLLSIGFSGVVSKPFDRETIVSTIHNCLGKK